MTALQRLHVFGLLVVANIATRGLPQSLGGRSLRSRLALFPNLAKHVAGVVVVVGFGDGEAGVQVAKGELSLLSGFAGFARSFNHLVFFQALSKHANTLNVVVACSGVPGTKPFRQHVLDVLKSGHLTLLAHDV